jgi:hypothetical protein
VITDGLILITAQAADPEVNEVWSGWGSVLFTLVVLTLVTFAICFGIWQYLKTRRATLESRADIAREEAYRRLAEEATSVQNRTAAELHQLTEGMADLRVRVATIERVLREVE